MTEPSYTIEADAKGEFLRLTLVGDWNTEIAERFAADVAATLKTMLATGTRHGHLHTLVDMRRKMVVPQDVAGAFTKMIYPGSPSKRIAQLASGALHRMQVRRIADERCRLFEDEGEALAWLMEDDAAAKADGGTRSAA